MANSRKPDMGTGPDCKVQIISHNKTHGAGWFRSSTSENHSRDFLGGLALSHGTCRNSSCTQQDSLLSLPSGRKLSKTRDSNIYCSSSERLLLELIDQATSDRTLYPQSSQSAALNSSSSLSWDFTETQTPRLHQKIRVRVQDSEF